MTENYISDNIKKIENRIAQAAERSARNPRTIKLMAVTKFHSPQEIIAAYKAGIRLFGENRVQETCSKFSTDFSSAADFAGYLSTGGFLLKDAQLHLIGSLQRNKVRQILPLVTCIQSVDRLELLEEIAKQEEKLLSSVQKKNRVNLLLEVHTGEESKAGFLSEDEVRKALETAASLSLNVTGFMTMAPLSEDSAQIRHSFKTLRGIAERMQQEFTNFSLTELSMGMSGDFEIAIEEGSSLLRLGTAVFAPPATRTMYEKL